MSVSSKSSDLDGCVLELCAVIVALFKTSNFYSYTSW